MNDGKSAQKVDGLESRIDAPLTPAAAAHPKIYCVIPVFNRISKTLVCIECLKRQTYGNLAIVVADGGSTDGTADLLSKQHPDVVVLVSQGPLWWAGSTRLGIDWALQHSQSDDDFVMLVNNDTEFEPHYVQTLVDCAHRTGGAVGGIVVDEENPDTIIDAGVHLDWASYSMTAIREVPSDTSGLLETAFLPGRGTVIPISAIRIAGNVDDRQFPHYIADYEFTYRLHAKANLPLHLAADARIKTPVDTQPKVQPYDNPIWESAKRLRNLWNRRSKSNLVDHYRFIDQHAPKQYERRLKVMFVLRQLRWVFSPVIKPVVTFTTHYFLRPVANAAWNLIMATCGLRKRPVFVAQRDLDVFAVNEQQYLKSGVLSSADFDGYYVFDRPPENRGSRDLGIEALWQHARRGGPRFFRLIDAHGILFDQPHRDLTVWQRLGRYILRPGPMSSGDCDVAGLSASELLANGLIRTAGAPDYYEFTDDGIRAARKSLQLHVLLRRVANPLRCYLRRKALRNAQAGNRPVE